MASYLRSRASRSWHSPSTRRSPLLQTLGSPSPPGFDGGVRSGGVEGATVRRAVLEIVWQSSCSRSTGCPITELVARRFQTGSMRSHGGQKPTKDCRHSIRCRSRHRRRERFKPTSDGQPKSHNQNITHLVSRNRI
jgi:hypothetical protein